MTFRVDAGEPLAVVPPPYMLKLQVGDDVTWPQDGMTRQGVLMELGDETCMVMTGTAQEYEVPRAMIRKVR
jgi:hypothetical protein